MTNARRRVLEAVGAALAIGLLATGCSSASGTSSVPNGSQSGGAAATATPRAATTSDVGACALVTEAEAATALGLDPGAGEQTTSYGATTCVFGQYPQMITVNLAPTAGRSGYDRLHVPPKVGRLVELGGIGDASFDVLNPPVATVEFLRGNAVVAIVVVADGSQDRVVALAKAAAGRL